MATAFIVPHIVLYEWLSLLISTIIYHLAHSLIVQALPDFYTGSIIHQRNDAKIIIIMAIQKNGKGVLRWL